MREFEILNYHSQKARECKRYRRDIKQAKTLGNLLAIAVVVIAIAIDVIAVLH